MLVFHYRYVYTAATPLYGPWQRAPNTYNGAGHMCIISGSTDICTAEKEALLLEAVYEQHYTQSPWHEMVTGP